MSTPAGLKPLQLPFALRMQRRALRFVGQRSESTILRLAGSPPPVIRDRRLDPLIHLIAVNNAKQRPLHTYDPPAARIAMETGFAVLEADARPMKSLVDHDVPVEGGSIKCYVYHPGGEGPLPVLVYFHQGGCCIGSPRVCHTWCSILAAELPAIVVNVGYRLFPEHPFPAPVNDAIAAYHWARDHAAEWGGDPHRMAVAGDSAGGFLTAHVTKSLKDAGEEQPIAQMMIYPWTSIEQSYPSYQDFGNSFPLDEATITWFASHGEAGVGDFDRDSASPVLWEDLSGLAPAVVVTAGFDPLCDEGDHYAQRLREAGVPLWHKRYDSLSHSFTGMSGGVPAARSALEEIAREFRNIVHTKSVS